MKTIPSSFPSYLLPEKQDVMDSTLELSKRAAATAATQADQKPISSTALRCAQTKMDVNIQKKRNTTPADVLASSHYQ